MPICTPILISEWLLGLFLGICSLGDKMLNLCQTPRCSSIMIILTIFFALFPGYRTQFFCGWVTILAVFTALIKSSGSVYVSFILYIALNGLIDSLLWLKRRRQLSSVIGQGGIVLVGLSIVRVTVSIGTEHWGSIVGFNTWNSNRLSNLLYNCCIICWDALARMAILFNKGF